MPKCKKCGEKLTDDNTYKVHRKSRWHICKTCYKNYLKEYLGRHPEKRKRKKEINKKWHEANRKYHNELIRNNLRKHYLYGKKLEKPKRDRPIDSCCEICHYHKKLLFYHHWDDMRPWIGIWVCGRCHLVAEVTDNFPSHERVQNYLKIKNNILENCS